MGGPIISVVEVKYAIAKFTKPPDTYHTPAKLLKDHGSTLPPSHSLLFNNIFDGDTVLSDWLVSTFISILKKSSPKGRD